jgi:hypothetical protein
MQIKFTEHAVSSMVSDLDAKVWQEVAHRAIAKMPKPLLCKDSVNILQDAVFMHSKQPGKSAVSIHEEVIRGGKFYERGITGVSNILRRESISSLLGNSFIKESSKIVNKRGKHLHSKVVT